MYVVCVYIHCMLNVRYMYTQEVSLRSSIELRMYMYMYTQLILPLLKELHDIVHALTCTLYALLILCELVVLYMNVNRLCV